MGTTGLLESEAIRPTSVLGELLAAKRLDAGQTLEELSAGTGFTIDQIREVESGRHDLSATELAELLKSYRIRPIAGRLSSLVVEINLNGGSIAMRSTRRIWAGQPEADQNLVSYLCLVYENRGLALGATIPLKSVDLSLLRAALALRRDDVTAQLDRMGRQIPARLRRNRSLLAVAAAAGVAVAAGAIILVPAALEPSTSQGLRAASNGASSVRSIEGPANRGGAAIDPRIDIGTALVIERSPSEARGGISASRPDQGQAVQVDPRIDIGTAMVIERSAVEVEPPSPAASPRSSRGPPTETGETSQ